MDNKYYIGYDVIKTEEGANTTYEANINWFDGEDICMTHKFFPSEEEGYRWIADKLKEWDEEAKGLMKMQVPPSPTTNPNVTK
jgi:hypothetical protein